MTSPKVQKIWIEKNYSLSFSIRRRKRFRKQRQIEIKPCICNHNIFKSLPPLFQNACFCMKVLKIQETVKTECMTRATKHVMDVQFQLEKFLVKEYAWVPLPSLLLLWSSQLLGRSCEYMMLNTELNLCCLTSFCWYQQITLNFQKLWYSDLYPARSIEIKSRKLLFRPTVLFTYN